MRAATLAARRRRTRCPPRSLRTRWRAECGHGFRRLYPADTLRQLICMACTVGGAIFQRDMPTRACGDAAPWSRWRTPRSRFPTSARGPWTCARAGVQLRCRRRGTPPEEPGTAREEVCRSARAGGDLRAQPDDLLARKSEACARRWERPCVEVGNRLRAGGDPTAWSWGARRPSRNTGFPRAASQG